MGSGVGVLFGVVDGVGLAEGSTRVGNPEASAEGAGAGSGVGDSLGVGSDTETVCGDGLVVSSGEAETEPVEL